MVWTEGVPLSDIIVCYPLEEERIRGRKFFTRSQKLCDVTTSEKGAG